MRKETELGEPIRRRRRGKTQNINRRELSPMNDGFPDMYSFINYNPSIGVGGVHISGSMGSGKTEIAMNIDLWCLKNKQEAILLPADRFCEWRHFLIRDESIVKKITVIVPTEPEIHYFGKQFTFYRLKKYPDLIKKVQFTVKEPENLHREIINLLEKQSVIAVYDQHLLPPERAMLWSQILDIILNRTKMINTAIVFHFNEAGIYFPQYAQGKHWSAVQHFSQRVVDCRKGLVRLVLISQLKSEVEASIRKKLTWSIYRKGVAEDSMPTPIQAEVPFTPIDSYHIAEAGLYRKFNTIRRMKEFPHLWKMIPLNKSKLPVSPTGNKPAIKELLICQHCGYTWQPRKPKPKKCPRCKRPLTRWDTPT